MAAAEAGRRLHIIHVTHHALDYSRLVLRLGLALAATPSALLPNGKFEIDLTVQPTNAITSTSIVRAIPRIAPGTRDNVCISWYLTSLRLCKC